MKYLCFYKCFFWHNCSCCDFATACVFFAIVSSRRQIYKHGFESNYNNFLRFMVNLYPIWFGKCCSPLCQSLLCLNFMNPGSSPNLHMCIFFVGSAFFSLLAVPSCLQFFVPSIFRQFEHLVESHSCFGSLLCICRSSGL